jgi:hypothetical protein
MLENTFLKSSNYIFTPISLNYFFKSSYSSMEFAGEVYLEI